MSENDGAEPLNFPQMSQTDVELVSLIGFQRSELVIVVNKDAFVARVVQDKPKEPVWKWLKFDLGTSCFFLSINKEDVESLLDGDYEPGADDALQAVFLALSQPITNRLPHAKTDLAFAEPSAADLRFQLPIRWAFGALDSLCLLAFSEEQLPAVRPHLDRLFTPHPPPPAPITFDVLAGSMEISLETLSNIQVGDIIVMGSSKYPRRYRAVIQNRFEAVVKFGAQGTVRLISDLHPVAPIVQESVPMTNKDEPQDDDAPLMPGEDIRSLTVQLDFSLAEMALDINALSALSKGSVVELGDDPFPVVTIKVQGRKIAEGEIVALNMGHGVRITRRL